VRRKDSLAKSDGTARYTQDVQLPDMLVAMVAHAPRFGATVKSFDADDAKKVAGVVDVYEIPTGRRCGRRHHLRRPHGPRGAEGRVGRGQGREPQFTQTIAQQWRDIAAGKGPADLKWEAFDSKGDAAAASAGPKSSKEGAQVFETTYDFPYLAHATMEPMDCVAMVDGNKRQAGPRLPGPDPGPDERGQDGQDPAWLGRGRDPVRRRLVWPARHLHVRLRGRMRGLSRKKVGGGRPVKLVWTREDDMRAGYYRPLVHHAVRVVLDKDGYPAPGVTASSPRRS
jgi:isoquinoline 1-oxidoreductase beta subunit